MPYIQITDPYGHCRQISSSDNETVARWLIEVLTLFTSPDPAHGHIRIDVRPIWVGPGQGGSWDWHPAANRQFVEELRERTPIGNVRALARAMGHYADRIEEEGRG